MRSSRACHSFSKLGQGRWRSRKTSHKYRLVQPRSALASASEVLSYSAVSANIVLYQHHYNTCSALYNTLKNVPPEIWLGGMVAVVVSVYEVVKGAYEYLLCLSAQRADLQGKQPPEALPPLYGVEISGSSYFRNPTVQAAVQFAATAHQHQVRLTGEPYVAHCIETALIVELNLPRTSDPHRHEAAVVAALLHDVMDDAGVEGRAIEAEFGVRVASMVAKVSKLSAANQLLRRRKRQGLVGRSAAEESAEVRGLVRMIVGAVVEEPLVVLVKLADRLHNMRTAWALRPDRQQALAQETLDVWCTLAERLGWDALKSELEDLCFVVLHPKRYRQLRTALWRFWDLEDPAFPGGGLPLGPPTPPLSPPLYPPSSLLLPTYSPYIAAASPSQGTVSRAMPRPPPLSLFNPVARLPAISFPLPEFIRNLLTPTSERPTPAVATRTVQQQQQLQLQQLLQQRRRAGAPAAMAVETRQQAASTRSRTVILPPPPQQQQQQQQQQSSSTLLTQTAAAVLSSPAATLTATTTSATTTLLPRPGAPCTPSPPPSPSPSPSTFPPTTSTPTPTPTTPTPPSPDLSSTTPSTAALATAAAEAAADSQRQHKAATAKPPRTLSPQQLEMRELLAVVTPFSRSRFSMPALCSPLPPHMLVLERCAAALLYSARVGSYAPDLDISVQGRLKSICSVDRKMAYKDVPVTQVYDARALRVIVDDCDSARELEAIYCCYRLEQSLRGLFRPIRGEYDDYIANPKPSGYRALHLALLGPDGRPLEVQIKTKSMHHHAEYGGAAHWVYKEGVPLPAPVLKTDRKGPYPGQPVIQIDFSGAGGRCRYGVVMEANYEGQENSILVAVATGGTVPANPFWMPPQFYSGLRDHVVDKLYSSGQGRAHAGETGLVVLDEYRLCSDARWHRLDSFGRLQQHTTVALQRITALDFTDPVGLGSFGSVGDGVGEEGSARRRTLEVFRRTQLVRSCIAGLRDIAALQQDAGLLQSEEVSVLLWPDGRIKHYPQGTTAGEVLRERGSISIGDSWPSADQMALVNVNNCLVAESTELEDGDVVVLSRDLLQL